MQVEDAIPAELVKHLSSDLGARQEAKGEGRRPAQERVSQCAQLTSLWQRGDSPSQGVDRRERSDLHNLRQNVVFVEHDESGRRRADMTLRIWAPLVGSFPRPAGRETDESPEHSLQHDHVFLVEVRVFV